MKEILTAHTIKYLCSRLHVFLLASLKSDELKIPSHLQKSSSQSTSQCLLKALLWKFKNQNTLSKCFFLDQNRQLMELSQSEFETGSGQALAMIYPATAPLSGNSPPLYLSFETFQFSTCDNYIFSKIHPRPALFAQTMVTVSQFIFLRLCWKYVKQIELFSRHCVPDKDE